MRFQLAIATTLTFSLLTPAVGQNPASSPSPAPQQQNAPVTTTAQDDVVRVTTNLVQVDVVVTDKESKQITGLGPEDFEIFENKEKQKITNFSYVSTRAGTTTAPQVAREAAPAAKDAPSVPPTPMARTPGRRIIALVVDDLGLSFESMGYVQKALRKFVDEQVQPGDQVAVIRTSADAGSLQQLTTDKRQLDAAIEQVRWNPAGRGGLSPFADLANHGDPNIRESQQIFEEVEESRAGNYAVGSLETLGFVVRGLGELPGRKAVLFISEAFRLFNTQGRNVQLLRTMRRITDDANRSSTVIYTLDASGTQTLGLTAADNARGPAYLFDPQTLSDPGSGIAVPRHRPRGTAQRADSETARAGAQAEADSISAFKALDALTQQRQTRNIESQSVLSFLAQETGGLSVRNTNDLSVGIQRLLDDQQGYYLIAYRPEDSTLDPSTKRRRFRDVTVKVKGSGLRLRSRTGYYGVTDAEGRPVRRTRDEQLAAAVTSPFASSDIRVRLTSLFGDEPGTGSFMRSLLHVDARDLTFREEPDGSHKATMDIVAVNFGDNGRVMDQFSYEQLITLRGDAYRQALQHGLVYNFDFPVKQRGAYQLRVAVRDAGSERMGSARQYIEVPDMSKNRLTLSGIILKGANPPGANKATVVGASAQAANGNARSLTDDPQADPALRRLRQGMVLNYQYAIYNAQLDAPTNRPQLTTQMRLFRDGKQAFAGRVQPFEAGQQTDMKRLAAVGGLRLGPELVPGEYVLQVIVTDNLAKDKQNTATQFIDFEIVK